MVGRPQRFRSRVERQSIERRTADEARGSARERGYTPAWDRASRAFLVAHPLCLGCQAVGRTAASAVTDHVEPHRGDMAKFWDPDNWQPACAWHHDTVKQMLEARFARGELTVADLRLDSAAAIALTRELLALD